VSRLKNEDDQVRDLAATEDHGGEAARNDCKKKSGYDGILPRECPQK
jgi:hypothetical protein